jgi:glycosyltransferase involved in cell wall biosynthesis
LEFGIRVASTGRAPQQILAPLKANTHPWARLSLALFAESEKPGDGLEALVHLWEDRNRIPSALAGLVSRNLVVLMIRHNQLAQAEQFIELGLNTFPGYAELGYLGALLCFRQERPASAMPFLERAKAGDRGLLGSGGESSYRADWLLGLLATRVGNVHVAFDSFFQGMVARPAFVPAVEEILKLRVSHELVLRHEYDFCRLVRREPQLLEKVLHYLLVHRVFSAASRLIETVPLADDARDQWRERIQSAAAPFYRTTASPAGKPGVLVSGPFFEYSSLARINREMAASLLQSPAQDVCLEPSTSARLLPQVMPAGDALASAMLRHPARLDLTIRHQWPPDFRRPCRGKLAVILPWEYGAVPRVWVDQIERNIDELWVPSRFLRDVFVRAGVSNERIQVIPNGVDPRLFSPEGPTSRPPGCREFMFLFVGGAIRRKGIDLLLEAYQQAFEPGDQVTLVINSLGSSASYQHNNLDRLLLEFAANPRCPHLQVLTQKYDDATLASLYRGCDAFVLPYRGQGFGMPVLEAMACGRPVITTAAGPSQDFCTAEISYRISAREVEVPDDPPPLGPLSGEFTWFEPDVDQLAETMLQVYRERDKAVQRGRAAAKSVRQSHAWPQITALYRQRVDALLTESASELDNRSDFDAVGINNP